MPASRHVAWLAWSRPRIAEPLASLTAATVERWHDGPESANGAVPRWDLSRRRSWGRLGQRRQFRSGKNLCSGFEYRDISGRPPDRAERHEHANGRGLSGCDGLLHLTVISIGLGSPESFIPATPQP